MSGKLEHTWIWVRNHKYLVVLGFFTLLIGFIDENSLWQRYHNRIELNHLRSEIRKYSEMYEHDSRYLQEINTNPEVLVRIARERYYMKTDDEDLFVFRSTQGQ